jgi:hypothetical protein
MIVRICSIIFFAVFGINCFIPFAAATLILGIVAIVLAIALIIGA